MAQKQNRPNNIYPYNDWVLIVEQKYAKRKMEGNDLMDTLLIYEGNKIIKQEPVREKGPKCRHCKGYFSYEMSFLRQ